MCSERSTGRVSGDYEAHEDTRTGDAVAVRMQVELPSDGRYVHVLRNMVTCLLKDVGLPSGPAADLQVAVSEACSNVVRHADGVAAYTVSLVLDDEGVEVEVRDAGGGTALSLVDRGHVAELDDEQGRGLHLMRALTDELAFERREDGTVVTFVKRWPVAVVR